MALSADVVGAALRTRSSRVRKPYNVLAEPEVGAILRAADTDRDGALLATMLGAGLRVSEVTGLDVSDLLEDAEGGAALYVRQGKGRKDRTGPVQPEVAVVVRRYLASTGRRLGDAGPLFPAHDRAAAKLTRGRLTARAAGDVVRRTAHRAGIDAKAVSPHVLRYTFAIRALRNGADIVAVAKLLDTPAWSPPSATSITSRPPSCARLFRTYLAWRPREGRPRRSTRVSVGRVGSF